MTWGNKGREGGKKLEIWGDVIYGCSLTERHDEINFDNMNEWQNVTMNKTCSELTNNGTKENLGLEAFSACLSSEARFYYTIGFLLLSIVFYLIEFLVLESDYEPTGLRSKITVCLP